MTKTQWALVATTLVSIACAAIALRLTSIFDDRLATKMAALEKEYTGKKALADLDVEAQKRIVEQKDKDLDAAAESIAKLQAEVTALKGELDPDGDGVKALDDACPTSKPTEGGPTAVNKKGCLDDEAALSCTRLRETVDQPGVRWEFYDCPLADDADVAYVCTATWSESEKRWTTFTECAAFDAAHPGG